MKQSKLRKLFHSKKGEFFVGVGVKILISVVIGATLLGGTYALAKDTVLPTVNDKIENLFSYNGSNSLEISDDKANKIEFSIDYVGSYEVEEGTTWAEWISSYGISAGDNGIVWICYDGLGGTCTSADEGQLAVDIGNGLGDNKICLNGEYVMYTDIIQATDYNVDGPT